jgi:hypothetical protein
MARVDGESMIGQKFRIVLYTPKTFNRQTRARFFRDRRARWVMHLGGNVTDAQAMMIEHVVALEWDVRRLEARQGALAASKLSAHARNELACWRRQYELAVRRMGPPAKAQPPSLAEMLEKARREGPARPPLTKIPSGPRQRAESPSGVTEIA